MLFSRLHVQIVHIMLLRFTSCALNGPPRGIQDQSQIESYTFMRFVDTLFLRFISPEDQGQVNVSDSRRRRWPADGVQANIRFVLSKFKVGVRWGEVVLAKHECVWYVGSLCFVGAWHSTTWLHRLVRYVDEAVRYGYGTLVRGNGTWYGASVRGYGTGAGGHDTWYGMLALGSCNVLYTLVPWYNAWKLARFAYIQQLVNHHVRRRWPQRTHVARQAGWLPIPVQPELAPCN